jgi:hypothetical protein
MAAPILVPDNETVYRGMAASSWCKQQIVNYLAFMLRPATEQYPLEEDLSLGRTAASSVDELRKHYGAAALSVAAVHALAHNILVLPDANNELKAEMRGLPLFSTEPAERSRAVAIATDLANVAQWVPVPPAN